MELEIVSGIKLPGLGTRDVALLKGDTHIGRWVKETGRLDHDQATLTRIASIPGVYGGVLWDVGAYVGDHTCAYACMGRRVVAIEGALDAYSCLSRNVERYPNVISLSVAVGDHVLGFEPSLDVEPNGGARRLKPGKMFETVTIDFLSSRVLAETVRPSFIKLDIEGWEVRALRGASETLHKVRPVLVIEVNHGTLAMLNDTPHDMWKELARHGYDAADLFSHETWNPSDDVPQRDIVAWPRELGPVW